MAGAAAFALAASCGAIAQDSGNGNGDGGKIADAKQHDDESEKEAERRVDGRDRIESGRVEGDERLDALRDIRGGYDNRDERRVMREERDTLWLAQGRGRGFIDGCPPSFAKKQSGCNPSRQSKNRNQRSVFGYGYRPTMFGLSIDDRRGDYGYRDGYLVRYGNGGDISAWLPLLGGALGIGNVWPNNYQSYRVPDYYVDYFDLGGADRYRYANNVIYRVDPEDAAIISIAALITGDDFTIGQPMPGGYDVYNVPDAYRERYYDTSDYMYRYSDGYVYQVDPKTRVVVAAIDMLI